MLVLLMYLRYLNYSHYLRKACQGSYRSCAGEDRSIEESILARAFRIELDANDSAEEIN